jgi:hypothetical protein
MDVFPAAISIRTKSSGLSSRRPRRDSIAALDVQDVILDGEIVALDDRGRPAFQLLQASTWAWCGRQLFSTHLICCILRAIHLALPCLPGEFTIKDKTNCSLLLTIGNPQLERYGTEQDFYGT